MISPVPKFQHRLRISLLLLGGTLIVCLLGAEIFLRLVIVQMGTPEPVFFTFDDTLGWKGKPNFRAEFIRGSERIAYEMNRWGFRDDQPPPQEQVLQKRRIMFLGDSYAMGYEIPKDDRVSELLEKADATNLTYNFGILGYSADQELLVLKKFGSEVKPDVVLLFFCLNDIYYSERNMAGRQAKPLFRLQADGALALTNVPLLPPRSSNPILEWLPAHLALAKVVTQGLGRITVYLRPRGGQNRGEAAKSKWEEGRGGIEEKLIWSNAADVTDLTYYIMRDMLDECRRLGASLIIFMCPSNQPWTETRDDSPEGIKLAQQWFDQLGIPCVDLFPVFRQDFLKHHENLYIYDKMHWNARANRLVADVVLKAIDEKEAEPRNAPR